ncbi:MAG: hypothetical protein SFU98_09135 [Leptospiraceae bacterium]|nr:hypothetical protein [Leptospiraceae bacterium]
MSEAEKLNRILEILVSLESTLHSNSPNNGYKIVLFLIPIFGIVFGCGLLFAIFYWWHKQKLELIRSGNYRPFHFDLKAYSFFLGLLLTFTGLALSIVFIIVMGKSMAILGGLVPFAVGLSLLTYYKLGR